MSILEKFFKFEFNPQSTENILLGELKQFENWLNSEYLAGHDMVNFKIDLILAG